MINLILAIIASGLLCALFLMWAKLQKCYMDAGIVPGVMTLGLDMLLQQPEDPLDESQWAYFCTMPGAIERSPLLPKITYLQVSRSGESWEMPQGGTLNGIPAGNYRIEHTPDGDIVYKQRVMNGGV